MKKNVWELFLVVILILLLIIRCGGVDNQNPWMQFVSIGSVCIALVDLWILLEKKFGDLDNFDSIRGILFCLAVILVILSGFTLTGQTDWGSKGSDIFTLLALLLTLPRDLYCDLVRMYVKKIGR